jgi:hypothetical protein
VADVEIRKQTHNKKGLQDALRGMLDAGGDITHDWELADVLKIGDRATGTTVLTDQYAAWKDKPVHVDLASLWNELGIVAVGKAVRLTDDAPLAAIRRAITTPEPPNQSSSAVPPSAVFAGRAVTASKSRP